MYAGVNNLRNKAVEIASSLLKAPLLKIKLTISKL
jgi:hypothetical protein